MSLEEFLTAALAPTLHERRGQALMNRLYTVKPELYEHLTASRIDPFYNDNNLWAAVQWLRDNWSAARAIPPVAW